MERFDELKDMLEEKSSSVAEDHPVGITILGGLLAIAVSIPLCVGAYKYVGKTAGKAAAKELVDAGVWLGYTHP